LREDIAGRRLTQKMMPSYGWLVASVNNLEATMKTSFEHSLEMACEHLYEIGCDGNAIELREHFAALVAVAEAANKIDNAMECGFCPPNWAAEIPTFGTDLSNYKSERREFRDALKLELQSALANLAAVREGKAQR
jgi:hypothetical protein